MVTLKIICLFLAIFSALRMLERFVLLALALKVDTEKIKLKIEYQGVQALIDIIIIALTVSLIVYL